MTARIAIIKSFYPEFLEQLYASEPDLARQPYDAQISRLLASGFGIGDAYSHELRQLGWEAHEIIVNADKAQREWARDHGLSLPANPHEMRRAVVDAQIQQLQPDVALVLEWCPLGDAFLMHLKAHVPLLVGQISTSLHHDRTFAAYDLMLSSWPPLVDYFRSLGMDARPFRLGFDARVLDALSSVPRDIDVSFVGGFAPSHVQRVAWLESLLNHVDVAVFGYGVERLPPDSPIRAAHRGPVWGRDMYQTLARSRITLHAQADIDVRGTISNDYAVAMRLYEATGVGALLITEHKANLPALFAPGREIITCAGLPDFVEKIRYYLAHENERSAVALAGQQRTLCDHTYGQRMEELADILDHRLHHALPA